ncbi:hypothetical protein [Marinobacter sp. ELB17]|uniref:hypothetical protein n=1 Tax=Marinobacter sp. ELB17 TaxID=270374 RepID=UPI0000F38207|nr:hypothetical protein [Marinobacter sp. ELB17]EAZ98154.1 BfpE [Marinobacter sp. ELB17]
MKTKLAAFFQNIPAQDRVEFYGFLRTLLESGMNLQNACGLVASTLEEQAATRILGKSRILKVAKLYRYAESGLRGGQTLHDLLTDRVPEAEVMMLMAGSKGSLSDGLKAAERAAHGSSVIQDTFIKGLLYPVGMGIAVVVSMYWIGNNLLQTLIMLKPLEKWEPTEQSFYWATQNIGIWLPIALLVITGLILLTYFTNKLVVGDVREKLHSIPPLNVIRQTTAATLLTTLSSLILAGETIRGALNRMEESSASAYMVHYIRLALINIRVGLAAKGPGKALASKLFTPWIIVKLEIYSRGEADQFAHKMTEIADDAQQNAVKTMLGFSKLIGNVMLIVAATVIGFTVTTMYSITGSIQSGAGM